MRTAKNTSGKRVEAKPESPAVSREGLAGLSRALAKRAEVWRTEPNDPHNINTAVYVALFEAAEAIKDALAMSPVQEGNKAGRESELQEKDYERDGLP